jgi:hypothetical protein
MAVVPFGWTSRKMRLPLPVYNCPRGQQSKDNAGENDHAPFNLAAREPFLEALVQIPLSDPNHSSVLIYRWAIECREGRVVLSRLLAIPGGA